MVLAAAMAEAAWQLAAHLFLISVGKTGLESWSWWVQSMAAMLP